MGQGGLSQVGVRWDSSIAIISSIPPNVDRRDEKGRFRPAIGRTSVTHFAPVIVIQ